MYDAKCDTFNQGSKILQNFEIFCRHKFHVICGLTGHVFSFFVPGDPKLELASRAGGRRQSRRKEVWGRKRSLNWRGGSHICGSIDANSDLGIRAIHPFNFCSVHLLQWNH